MLQRIIDWAKRQEDIRALILEGSLARGLYVDELSDIDINIYASSYDRYLKSDSWISELGDILVYIPEKFLVGEQTVYTRLVIFEDGTKVDFSFWTVPMLQDIIAGSLTYYDKTGYKILVDKDGMAAQLTDPLRLLPSLPDEQEYTNLVQSFWFEVHYVGKYLKREELFFARFIASGIENRQLFRMLEWHEKTKGNCDDSLYSIKHVHKWLSEDSWRELTTIFVGSEIEDNWIGLFKTITFFRRLALEVAEKLGYAYPHDIDRKMVALLKDIKAK